MQSLEEYLAKNGRLVYNFHGVSMRPLLRQEKNDLVVIRRKDERCRKYDVAIYHLPNDPTRYVLHRIVKVRPDGYDFLGDNCIRGEHRIPEDAVFGVLESVRRGGKTVSVCSRGFWWYSRVWVALYPLRMVYKFARIAAATVYRRLFRINR